jgi:uncharacterized protein YciI
MNFLLVGRFHSKVEDEDRAAVQSSFNEHLMQMHPKVKLAGPLKDDDGKWIGHAIIVEAETADEARRFAEQSPYHQAGLYEHFDVTRFDVIAGNLG